MWRLFVNAQHHKSLKTFIRRLSQSSPHILSKTHLTRESYPTALTFPDGSRELRLKIWKYFCGVVGVALTTHLFLSYSNSSKKITSLHELISLNRRSDALSYLESFKELDRILVQNDDEVIDYLVKIVYSPNDVNEKRRALHNLLLLSKDERSREKIAKELNIAKLLEFLPKKGEKWSLQEQYGDVILTTCLLLKFAKIPTLRQQIIDAGFSDHLFSIPSSKFILQRAMIELLFSLSHTDDRALLKKLPETEKKDYLISLFEKDNDSPFVMPWEQNLKNQVALLLNTEEDGQGRPKQAELKEESLTDVTVQLFCTFLVCSFLTGVAPAIRYHMWVRKNPQLWAEILRVGGGPGPIGPLIKLGFRGGLAGIGLNVLYRFTNYFFENSLYLKKLPWEKEETVVNQSAQPEARTGSSQVKRRVYGATAGLEFGWLSVLSALPFIAPHSLVPALMCLFFSWVPAANSPKLIELDKYSPPKKEDNK